VLLKVLPEKVSENWSYFAPAIYKSLPVGKPSYDMMVSVLEAILLERLLVWEYYEDGKPVFIMTTKMHHDNVVKNRKLLIYSITGMKKVTSPMIVETVKMLKKYGKSNMCESIIAFVENEIIINYLQKLGAQTDFRLIEMEIV
jgi:hypothetical protein